MRKMKNKKLKATLSITGYFLMLIAICFVGALVFHSYYYEPVYVHGNSMSPTLQGGESKGEVADFGIVDTHKSAINHIKRFDIVSTYYPYSAGYPNDYDAAGTLKNTASKKIKRVIALPNETFIIKNGLLSVKVDDEFKEVPYKGFNVNYSLEKDTTEPITLGKDEYWVLGDNRGSSIDCGYATIKTPIKKENIQGVLVAIEGKAKLDVRNYRCSICGKTYSTQSGPCAKCGSLSYSTQYKLVNKKYSWPKFF